ncbi:hypothetical protein F5Y11DRAFT_331801 [Daldinia sp. FL1419]|nr:hypothetical protein F5Y11DRAFT_331801 [Daldinia sp. FL1419]
MAKLIAFLKHRTACDFSYNPRDDSTQTKTKKYPRTLKPPTLVSPDGNHDGSQTPTNTAANEATSITHGTPTNLPNSPPPSKCIICTSPVSSLTTSTASPSISSLLLTSLSLSSQNAPSDSASIDIQNMSSGNGSPSRQFPIWAVPVIVVVGLIILVFLASLAAFCARERRRKKETGSKDLSYIRALGRAGAVATGVFIPIWIVGRYRKSRERKNQEQQETYQPQMAAYGKLEEPNRQSEEDAASTTSARPEETPLSPAALERGNSVVSSLSSSSHSRDRYEILDLPPSPMSEDTPYPWKLQDLPDTESVEKREASTEPVERTRLETPLGRRSGSISEKREPEG